MCSTVIKTEQFGLHKFYDNLLRNLSKNAVCSPLPTQGFVIKPKCHLNGDMHFM